MFITGQGINILNEKIYRAVRDRDGQTIRKSAAQQVKQGADGLDICLGSWNGCDEALSWIVEQIREVTDCPLFLPPCPQGLLSGLKKAGPGSFINCVTTDIPVLRSMFSAAACLDASVVVLLTRRDYLPCSLDEICLAAEEVIELAEGNGFPVAKLVLDPVLRPRAGYFSGGLEMIFPDITLFAQALYLIGRLREQKVKTMVGLSNITCGLPGYMHVGIQLQALKLMGRAGLDYVIMHTGKSELVRAAGSVWPVEGDGSQVMPCLFSACFADASPVPPA